MSGKRKLSLPQALALGVVVGAVFGTAMRLVDAARNAAAIRRAGADVLASFHEEHPVTADGEE